jgi:hypothetical protein
MITDLFLLLVIGDKRDTGNDCGTENRPFALCIFPPPCGGYALLDDERVQKEESCRRLIAAS